eukprot:TRINITY_DN47537_c0_g1_i1.p1 TRINITY_DN47537_c0_g1~~TRINITY_DN47537_c0_g1_i1.p1  ORF type:complete len:549 (+),score=158.70 TRINITY_DN47537_c0_g1_i1:145-1791(+)
MSVPGSSMRSAEHGSDGAALQLAMEQLRQSQEAVQQQQAQMQEVQAQMQRMQMQLSGMQQLPPMMPPMHAPLPPMYGMPPLAHAGWPPMPAPMAPMYGLQSRRYAAEQPSQRRSRPGRRERTAIREYWAARRAASGEEDDGGARGQDGTDNEGSEESRQAAGGERAEPAEGDARGRSGAAEPAADDGADAEAAAGRGSQDEAAATASSADEDAELPEMAAAACREVIRSAVAEAKSEFENALAEVKSDLRICLDRTRTEWKSATEVVTRETMKGLLADVKLELRTARSEMREAALQQGVAASMSTNRQGKAAAEEDPAQEAEKLRSLASSATASAAAERTQEAIEAELPSREEAGREEEHRALLEQRPPDVAESLSELATLPSSSPPEATAAACAEMTPPSNAPAEQGEENSLAELERQIASHPYAIPLRSAMQEIFASGCAAAAQGCDDDVESRAQVLAVLLALQGSWTSALGRKVEVRGLNVRVNRVQQPAFKVSIQSTHGRRVCTVTWRNSAERFESSQVEQVQRTGRIQWNDSYYWQRFVKGVW